MAAGRRQKPHYPSYGGDPIVGLYRCPDKRWRINATGQKFTEPDERRAIARFLAWKENHQPAPAVELEANPLADLPPIHATAAINGQPANLATAQMLAEVATDPAIDWMPGIQISAKYKVPEALVWAWLRDALIHKPEWIAAKTGIPEVAGLRYLPLPQKTITLRAIADNYKNNNGSTAIAKRDALAVLDWLVKFTDAKTLDDLTVPVLARWKNKIEKDVAGPGTRRAYYTRIRSVIGFGLKTGMDAVQIRAALDRCKILWTREAMPSVDPKPISKADFHELLKTGNGNWRAFLLLGLNLCLHIDEVCGLTWDDFDLKAGTYRAIRNKTKRRRIPRAAVLWQETIAAMNALPRKSPYVFTSLLGTRFNRSTRLKEFALVREAAKVDVSFDSIRDGAYTAACNGCDERIAKVLAGHSAGMQDHYVLRNPTITKPACDAVYVAYGPF
jgi:integrase